MFNNFRHSRAGGNLLPLLISLALLPLCAQASDCKKPNSNSPWKGTNVAIGGSDTSGNTDTQTLNSAFNLNYIKHKFQFTSNDTFNFGRTKGKGVTASKLYLSAQAQYNFAKRNYSFLNGNYTDDRFDGYRYVANVSAGYGRRFIDYKGFTFDLQAGPGVQRSVKVLGDGDNKTNDNVAGNFVANIKWKIGENSLLSEDISVVTSKINTRYISTTALSTNIYSKLALQLSFQAQRDTKPLAGKKSYNSISQISLVYTFA